MSEIEETWYNVQLTGGLTILPKVREWLENNTEKQYQCYESQNYVFVYFENREDAIDFEKEWVW